MRRLDRRGGNRAGFTLLEALIATVIVGLAAVAALAAFGTELRTAARARRALEADALATERMSQIELLPVEFVKRLPDSLARGQFSTPFEQYRWLTEIRVVPHERDLYDVGVRVIWDDGEQAFRTRLFRPQLVVVVR